MNGEQDRDEPLTAADEAVRWFTRLQDDEAKNDDWLAFERWLSAAPEHQAAYDRVERLWVEVEPAEPLLSNPSQVVANPTEPVVVQARSRRRRGVARSAGVSRRAWGMGLAALAASLVVAVVGVRQWSDSAAETYVTAPGQTRKVDLADGTHVWLNAQTKIDVRLRGHARKVEMADGEAVFEVAHDPSRPFLISVGDREVRVVGTEFNLRQRDGDFDLMVRRGVVEVRPAGSPTVSPIRVSAGHRLSVEHGAGTVLAETATGPAFAWTEGRLVYTDARLDKVAADLSRSLGAPIRVADAATARIRFSGVLELDDRAAVLRRLAAFLPVRVEDRPDGAVLHRR